jgi:N-acetylmuramoyl-L-alanine amidase
MKFNETTTYKKLVKLPANNKVLKVIMHHSGGTDLNPLLDTSHHTAQMMESWHLSKGWDGLGYTFVIHKDGAIWAGRPEHRSGAHTVNQNAQSIGICLSGNFDATYPTKEQEEAFKELWRYLYDKYGPLPIYGHRDFARKTCPGNNIPEDYFAELAEKALRSKIEIQDNTPEAEAFIEMESPPRFSIVRFIIRLLKKLL